MKRRNQINVIGLISAVGLWIGLMLVTLSSAENYFIGDSSVKMISDSIGDSKPGKTIKGEIVRVEGDNYYVKQEDGVVVRMHVDKTTITKGTARAKPGDIVDAKVNTAGHAISFLTDQPISH